MDKLGVLSQAGVIRTHECGGDWWAATPKDDWPDEISERATIVADWDPKFGDRRQELVFIGVNMDENVLKSQLHACLLTDEEMSRELC